jgi:hypothetical protein
MAATTARVVVTGVIDPVGAFRGVERSLAHELGHAMHQTCGDHVLTRWREHRSIDAEVPSHGHGHEGHAFNSVAEDFAESAMAWLTRGEFRVRSPIARSTSSGVPPHGTSFAPPPEVDRDAASLFVVCP